MLHVHLYSCIPCAAYSLLFGVYMGEIFKLFYCKINEDIMVSLMRFSLFPKYNLLPVLGHRHSPELCSTVMLLEIFFFMDATYFRQLST